MYRKKQHFGAHKTANNIRKQHPFDPPPQGLAHQDTRYTPTPIPDNPGSGTTARIRLESENRNWVLINKESRHERQSPDSALTASSNGSNPSSFHRGTLAPPKFQRSQSIPNLFQPPPPPEHPRRGIPADTPTGNYRTNGFDKTRHHGPINVHQGPFVRVKVGPYDDSDAGPRVIESSSLVKNKYKSEPNLQDANETASRSEIRQPFSVRTIEMKKALGMFGFVLSCKYVLNDPLVPRELRSYPRIDTVSVEGVAYRSGIRHGHFVLEINGKSAELSSLSRCDSLLQLGRDNLRIKIASNHQTNEPLNDGVPPSDLPRPSRVCYRESSLQKRMQASSRPSTQHLNRASSTPNLAEDNNGLNNVYEELTEFTLPDGVPTTPPTPQVGQGRRGSDQSKRGKSPGVVVSEKHTRGPENVNKYHPQRLETVPQRSSGRSGVHRAIMRQTSVDTAGPGGSGDFPPSPPPRPVSDWVAPTPGKWPHERGTTPGLAKADGSRYDGVGGDGRPVQMKISPGFGITSIACSTPPTPSASDATPTRLSSFSGPFKDDPPSNHTTPPSRPFYHPGIRAPEESHGSAAGLSMSTSQLDKAGMQKMMVENGRGLNTPVAHHPGRIVTMDPQSVNRQAFGSQSNITGTQLVERRGVRNTPILQRPTQIESIDMFGSRSNNITGTQTAEHDRVMDTSQYPGVTGSIGNPRSKEKFGSRNNVHGVAENGNSGLSAIIETPVNKARSVSTSVGNLDGNSELRSPHANSLQGTQGPERCATNRNEEPSSSLLEAIRKHPLMRNDRSVASSNKVEQNSTVAAQPHKQEPQQKIPPPVPPPPKSKTSTEISTGSIVNRYPTPGKLAPLSQEPTTLVDASEVRNLRMLKSANQDNSSKVQLENQRFPKAPQRPAPYPQGTKSIHQQQRGDVLLPKSGTKSKEDQDNRYPISTPAELRGPRYNLGFNNSQVLHLDGVTIDQSYSEDNRTKDELFQPQKPAYRKANEPEPRFDVSTRRLLLTDATVDQSCTEMDPLLPPILPPPPPVFDFNPGFRLSQIPPPGKPDSPWSRSLESSNPTFSPFSDRSLFSVESESVFLDSVASPPPPLSFTDPDQNTASKVKYPSDITAANPAPLSSDLHSKASRETSNILRRFGVRMNQPKSPNSTIMPPIPPQFQPPSSPFANPLFRPDKEPHSKPSEDTQNIPRRMGIQPPTSNPISASLLPLQFQHPSPPFSNPLFRPEEALHSKPSEDPPNTRKRFGNQPPAANPANAPLPPPEFQSVQEVSPQTKKHPPAVAPPSRDHRGRPDGAVKQQVPPESSVSVWSCSDVANWLRQVGLSHHAPVFLSRGIDGQRLTSMTRRDLIELGVTEMTDRRDIERGVLRLKSLLNST